MASNATKVVAEFRKAYGKESGLIFRGIILEILARIIERTPVDKGRLASNWQAGVNVVPTNVLDKYSPGGSMATANDIIATATPEERVILANNLPYAVVAEEGLWGTSHAASPGSKVTSQGFSKKAKSGMVAITVAEFDDIVTEVVRQFK